MAKRLPLLLIALLIMGFTVAGCGDDDDKSSDKGSSDTAAQTEATPASSDTTAETTSSDDSGDKTDDSDTPATPDVSNNPQVKAAVKQCKQSVNSAPQLKSDTKKKLEDICEKAARGDQSGIKEASKEVCLAILEDTGVSGAAADQAKQQCEAISK